MAAICLAVLPLAPARAMDSAAAILNGEQKTFPAVSLPDGFSCLNRSTEKLRMWLLRLASILDPFSMFLKALEAIATFFARWASSPKPFV
uniref:Putative secreted protein n=1 Tax=Ixodes ricinus TaxID=34613 RepID=A0A6B0UAQ3_IXORI